MRERRARIGGEAARTGAIARRFRQIAREALRRLVVLTLWPVLASVEIVGGADDQVGLSATRRAALGQRLACMERLKIRVDFAALECQQRVRSGIERLHQRGEG